MDEELIEVEGDPETDDVDETDSWDGEEVEEEPAGAIPQPDWAQPKGWHEWDGNQYVPSQLSA